MFKIEIKTSNAAFDDENDGNASEEIARILETIKSQIRAGYTEAIIRDANGAKVGSWCFHE